MYVIIINLGIFTGGWLEAGEGFGEGEVEGGHGSYDVEIIVEDFH